MQNNKWLEQVKVGDRLVCQTCRGTYFLTVKKMTKSDIFGDNGCSYSRTTGAKRKPEPYNLEWLRAIVPS